MLIDFLKEEIHCFSWDASDMPRIDPKMITHKLNIDLSFKLVGQKRKMFTPKKIQVINEEVDKFQKKRMIREVRYPDWLANCVVVKKKNRKNRVCIDFVNLNKAYPKDSFPLSMIDRLVDATVGHEMMSFLNAFFKYNHILMHLNDQNKNVIYD